MKTKNALGSTIISLEAIKKQVRVLEELKSFIPPPITEEFVQLEKNILQYGCKDALVVWESTERLIDPKSISNEPAYVLIDGHNRLQICQKNNIPFTIQLMSFSSLSEVKEYMIDLQLGRRNLTPQQASYFRGLRYQNEKSEKGKYDRNDHKVHYEPYGSTAEKLATEFKVSTSTIKRDALLAEGLERVAKPLRDRILSGEISIDKKTIQQLANLPSGVGAIQNLKDIPTEKQAKKTETKTTGVTLNKSLKQLGLSVKALTKTRDKTHLATIKNQLKVLEKLL